MDILTEKEKLLKAYPELLFVEREFEARGDSAVSLTLENVNVPRYPIIVTMYKNDGIYVDFGARNSIIEFADEVDSNMLSAIERIINDTIYVCVSYDDEDAFNEREPKTVRFFSLDEPETREACEKYVQRMLRAPSAAERINPFAQMGIVEMTNWSGSEYKKLARD